MPHRCIECKNVLESGELDLDKGCPVCGGKKFQYIRPKKEAKEKDLRKLTVAEYVAHAAASEHGPEAPGPKAEEPAEKARPEAHDKRPAAERIESVRILEKGRYDINLPVLLSRKELVMSGEEGVYVVDLPSALKTPGRGKKRWQKEG